MNSTIQVRMAVYETCTVYTHVTEAYTQTTSYNYGLYRHKRRPTCYNGWTQIVHRSTRVEDDNRQITTALHWRSRHALITTPISFGSQYTPHTSYNQTTQQSLATHLTSDTINCDAQINFPESGRGLGHVTPTIVGSTVGCPSNSLASCELLGHVV